MKHPFELKIAELQEIESKIEEISAQNAEKVSV